MRVEQRIGRVDRIGASYSKIHVSNYFYSDTVEEQVYKGIAEDYGDFTNIVGEAAPVLANVEKAIEQLALTQYLTDEVIAAEVADIRQQVDDVRNRPVSNDDLGAPADPSDGIEPPPILVGETTLEDLHAILTSNPLTRPHLKADSERPGVYSFTSVAGALTGSVSFDSGAGVAAIDGYQQIGVPSPPAVPVTFDRQIWDDSQDPELILLTYGTPELAALLPCEAENIGCASELGKHDDLQGSTKLIVDHGFAPGNAELAQQQVPSGTDKASLD